ncbi:SsgA family sporulation/cell division regulator [Streptomyces sp. NPDC002690]
MKKSHLALEITRWLDDDLASALACEFSYDPHDPLAVTMVFRADSEWPVRWVVSRDLLAEGMTLRAGEGDVVLWPTQEREGVAATFFMRIGGARTAFFEIPTEPFAEWLAATYLQVRRGAELEGADWDALVQLAE